MFVFLNKKSHLLQYALIILLVVIDQALSKVDNNNNKNRVSKIQIKLGSLSTITFLYEKIFTINYQDSSIKNNQIPSFCQLKQSNFIASDEQDIDITNYCQTNCLLAVRERYVYIVNEIKELYLFILQEDGTNQDLKIPYFSLQLLSKVMIDDDLKPEKLAKSRLLLNSNLSLQATLFTPSKIHWFVDGKLYAASFDSSKFEESFIDKMIVFKNYVFIPDDYTGIQIYKFIYQEKSQSSSTSPLSSAKVESHMNITISQFFDNKQWQYIQEQLIKNQQEGNVKNTSSSSANSTNFEFNFSLKQIQQKAEGENINIFTYEQYSKCICVFSVDLTNKQANLIEQISTNGKISQLILQDNFLYAEQSQLKGIREVFSLIELQQQNTSTEYLTQQNYPITSPITKIVTSDSFVYALQENIISIIKRAVPFKYSSEEDSRQQISIQYSDGANDMWPFHIQFKSNQLSLLGKYNVGLNQGTNNQNVIQNEGLAEKEEQSDDFFSHQITQQDNENILQQVDAILVKKDNSLTIRIIEERLPHLSCTPEDDKSLNDEYEVFVQIEAFDFQDISGNIKLKTYIEGLSISVYREIFENSTVALVVGLSIGLTLTLIAIILFCIYFYRMKNHYQLLLQDTNRSITSSSINTSSDDNNSDNSTSESQSTVPNKINKTNKQSQLSNTSSQVNRLNEDRNLNQIIQDQSNNRNHIFVFQQNQPEQENILNLKNHQFYFNGQSNQQSNPISRHNNTQINYTPNQKEQELHSIRNAEQHISLQ